MTRRVPHFTALLVTCAAFVQAEQSIESFDNLSGGNAFFAGTWEVSSSFTGTTNPATSIVQGAGVLDIVGTGLINDADSFLELHFSTPLDLGDDNAVSLEGTVLDGNAATSVEIRLFDLSGKSAYAAVLTGQLPSVTPWVAAPGFDPTAVEIVRISGGQVDGTAVVALRLDALSTTYQVPVVVYHDADTDRDFRLSLGELLRVIELYNTRWNSTRSGRYQVQDGTDDGFAADTATAVGAPPALGRYHSADVDQDAQISLGELLRVIELYNTRSGSSRSGEYHRDTGTSDGFSAGPTPGG